MPSEQTPFPAIAQIARGTIAVLLRPGSSYNNDKIISNYMGCASYETRLSHTRITAWGRTPCLWLFFSLGMIDYAGTIMRLTYQMRIAHEKRPILDVLATLNP